VEAIKVVGGDGDEVNVFELYMGYLRKQKFVWWLYNWNSSA
jgi:hypothetical protein